MNDDVTELVERIRQGIARYGIYMLDEADLCVVWDHAHDEIAEVRRMHLMNFARFHGFALHLDPDLGTATFRNVSEKQ